jgi:hypothetical protein
VVSIQENNQEEDSGFFDKRTKIIIALCICFGVIFSLSFIIGAWFSCNAGEGTLAGLKCNEVKIVAACERLTGELYTVSENDIYPFGETREYNFTDG